MNRIKSDSLAEKIIYKAAVERFLVIRITNKIIISSWSAALVNLSSKKKRK